MSSSSGERSGMTETPPSPGPTLLGLPESLLPGSSTPKPQQLPAKVNRPYYHISSQGFRIVTYAASAFNKPCNPQKPRSTGRKRALHETFLSIHPSESILMKKPPEHGFIKKSPSLFPLQYSYETGQKCALDFVILNFGLCLRVVINRTTVSKLLARWDESPRCGKRQYLFDGFSRLSS